MEQILTKHDFYQSPLFNISLQFLEFQEKKSSFITYKHSISVMKISVLISN